MTEEELEALLAASLSKAEKSGYSKGWGAAIKRITVFRDNLIPYGGKVDGVPQALAALDTIIEAMRSEAT